MHCCVLTASGGSKNGKRNYSAANRGARAEQHCNSSIDFLTFGSPQKKWSAEREGVNEPVPILADARQRWRRNRCADQVVLAKCLCSRRLRQRLRRQHVWSEPDKCPRTINS